MRVEREVVVFAGTRPEIIKAAPLIHAGTERVRMSLVLTGQHHDDAMAGSFLRDLSLHGAHRLTYPSGDMLAGMFAAIRTFLATSTVDAVAAVGDTSTVALAALASLHAQVPFVHVEAGLRSGNRRSLEEGHRKMAASLASLHLAPTVSARENLLREGVDPERVAVVGNTVIDAVDLFALRRPSSRRGVLFTAHRATNVDDPARLAEIVAVARALQRRFGRLVWPVHPRTAAALGQDALAVLRSDGLDVRPPLEYAAMLAEINDSELVVTDSGGVQEEAARLAVPLVIMRSSTPRPEGVDANISALAGVNVGRVLAAAERLLTRNGCDASTDLYGDGRAAPRSVDVIDAAFGSGLLSLAEPVLA